MIVLQCHAGDIVRMKKPHPCGKTAYLFEILRIGADVKLRCVACGHMIDMSREDFNKRVRSVEVSAADSQEEG